MAVSTGAAILGAAALGGAVGLYSSHESSKAAAEATEAQLAAQGNAAALQLRYLREVRADIADAVDKGLIDLDTGFNAAISELQPYTGTEAYDQYQNLLLNPETIAARPTYQYQYGQGIDALNAAFSKSSGGGVSGSSIKAAMEYGQNYAASALDAELARLSNMININYGASTNISNLLTNQGISKSNLRMSGASGSGNVTQSVANNLANIYTGMGETSATGIINQSNINTNLLSSLSNQGTNLALLYAMNPTMFGTNAGKFTINPGNNWSGLPIT
jgi:hypothetical protein